MMLIIEIHDKYKYIHTLTHMRFRRLRIVNWLCGKCTRTQTQPAARRHQVEKRTLNKMTSVNNISNTTNTRASFGSIRTFSRGSNREVLGANEQSPLVHTASVYSAKNRMMPPRANSIPKKPALSVIDSVSNEQEQSRI